MRAEPVLDIPHAGQQIDAIAFSPDGALLATGGEDAHLWDAATGRPVATLGGHDRAASSVAFSPGGRTLVTADFTSIHLWDVPTGRALHSVQAHTGWVYRADVSPDGKRIASVGLDNHVRLWGAATLTELATLRMKNPTEGVAFTPDGTKLAVAVGPAVALLDASTLREERPIGRHRWQARPLSFSPDGTRLASGSYDAVVKVWDVGAGRELHHIKAHKLRTWCVAFSPDAQLLASGGNEAAVKLWDPTTGTAVTALRFPETTVAAVAFSPNGRQLAAAGDGAVRIWALHTP